MDRNNNIIIHGIRYIGIHGIRYIELNDNIHENFDDIIMPIKKNIKIYC